jgi:3-oxoacyl-[acyl-carrier protein] reductase
MKMDDFQRVVDVNLNSTFLCSKEAIRSMMRIKRGRIVNISSVVGQVGNAGQVNYAASKAAILGLTKALAKEYASYGICVNAVCPGFIESDMTANISPDHLSEIIHKIPLKRIGTGDEVAGLVRFLALDPSASYITGHALNIDGGFAIGAT